MSTDCQGEIAIKPGSPRWEEINASAFEHERAGLRHICELLPDADPYHAWANVEFVGVDGSVNEVDLLVLTPSGLYVLELKHWHGEVSGDGFQWRRNLPNGKTRLVDNPLLLANRKAKRLKSVLGHYAGLQGGKVKAPFVKAAVFLHAGAMRSCLDPIGRQHVYGLDRLSGLYAPAVSGLPSIRDLLTARLSTNGAGGAGDIDRKAGREIVALIKAAGVRASVAERTVGQLLLAPRPYAEGPGWQDYLAGHNVATDEVRRVRFYLTSRVSDAERDMVQRAAEREYRLLQGIHHDGIVRATDIHEHPYGPAVVFEHDEESERLDRWLAERADSLTVDQRLGLVQQLADIMRYAHSRRLVHRNLNPRSVLVRRPDSARPKLLVIDWQTGGRVAGSGGSGSGPTAGSTLLGGTLHLEQLADEAARVYQAPEIANPEAPGPLLDVFSLGALTYLIFAGRPPATTVAELHAALERDGGLDVSAALDGAPTSLIDLIFDATLGDTSARIQTVVKFLDALGAVEEELTAPEPVTQIDPAPGPSGRCAGGRVHGGAPARRRRHRRRAPRPPGRQGAGPQGRP